MLNQLSIKNVAVIDFLCVSFENGMSVLSGETGAGKSIIIDSINMILGEKTRKELVRYGTKCAEVQAVFDVNDKELVAILEEKGINLEENQLIITRQVNTEGKSLAKINGMMVTLSELRDVTNLLVNIHGQHDNQALLSPKEHIKFLDDFAETENELSEYFEVYQKVDALKKKIDSLDIDEQEKNRRLDLLAHQVDEIKSANLMMGEEEELKEQLEICENAEKISSKIEQAYKSSYENDEMPSAYDSISVAVNALGAIKEYDKALSSVYDTLLDAMYSIEDASHDMKNFAEGIEHDEKKLDELSERLDLIQKLKRKYGATVEDVISYGKKASDELSGIVTGDELLLDLKKELKKEESKLSLLAQKLSKRRREAASVLSSKIEASLKELNMEKTSFCIDIDETDVFAKNGIDNVEFMISTNPGEPLKPLVKIASGGELSRVMLAIKSVVSEVDGVDTLIFDEIDTGVSGTTAAKIASKLKGISKNKQVFCITHLPQLTSVADNHYLIEKNTDGEGAKTTLTHLNHEGRVREIARLIDGKEATESAYRHAEELLKKS